MKKLLIAAVLVVSAPVSADITIEQLIAEAGLREGGEPVREHPGWRAPQKIIGDDTRLRQIILNLLSNAAKFTHEGSIALGVTVASHTESTYCLQFSVADTGIGIPTDKLQSLFDPFLQADASTTRKYGGTGLGLSISSKLTELMGGRIWVASRVNEGSTFYFTIYADATEISDLSDGTILAGKSACIVSGSHSRRMALIDQLRAWGMQVSAYESWQDTVTSDNLQSLDVVLIDSCCGYGRYHEELGSVIASRTSTRILFIGGRKSTPPPKELAGFITTPIKQKALCQALKEAIGHTPVPA